MGLIVFERIMLLGSLILTGYNFEPTLGEFLYGAPGKFGPWDFMTLALAVLFTAQCFQAYKAIRLNRGSRTGFLLGTCNIVMIGLLSFGLLINWAYFNPEKPGAPVINSSAQLLNFEAFGPFEQLRRSYDPQEGWQRIDEYTVRNELIGLVIKEELVKKEQPLELRRLNYLARHPNASTDWLTEGIYADHYYDLEGNLLTIYASDRWERVAERLEAAGRDSWDEDGEVHERYKKYYASLPKPRPFTYEEILTMVEASWEGISLEEAVPEEPAQDQPGLDEPQ